MSSPCQIEVVSFCDICPRLDSGSSHKTWIEYFQDVWKSCYCSPIFLKFLIKYFHVRMPDYSFLTLAPEAKDIPLNCSLVWKRLSASPPVAPIMLSPREAMISMSPGWSLLTLTKNCRDLTNIISFKERSRILCWSMLRSCSEGAGKVKMCEGTLSSLASVC